MALVHSTAELQTQLQVFISEVNENSGSPSPCSRWRTFLFEKDRNGKGSIIMGKFFKFDVREVSEHGSCRTGGGSIIGTRQRGRMSSEGIEARTCGQDAKEQARGVYAIMPWRMRLRAMMMVLHLAAEQGRANLKVRAILHSEKVEKGKIAALPPANMKMEPIARKQRLTGSTHGQGKIVASSEREKTADSTGTQINRINNSTGSACSVKVFPSLEI